MSPRVRTAIIPPAHPPHSVGVPVNIHHWDDISFLHWPFDPADVTPLLPEEVDVLTLEGKAWVGVTPFFIRVRPPGSPVVPPGWSFPETNVRTYVAGPDGRQGLWFLHMEVPARWFVAVLRSVGLPYVRRQMTVDAAEAISYRSEAGGSGEGGHDIRVRPGAALDPPAGGERERFLTAWWGAYHRRASALLFTPVDHPSWPLHAADLEACEVDGLFSAVGLPVPTGPPVVHYSPGVRVRVGRPQLVQRVRSAP